MAAKESSQIQNLLWQSIKRMKLRKMLENIKILLDAFLDLKSLYLSCSIHLFLFRFLSRFLPQVSFILFIILRSHMSNCPGVWG